MSLSTSPTFLADSKLQLPFRALPLKSRKVTDANHLLKKGIWAYFLLLLFEGALRKWVLPGLAAPLLIIRDPLALWLLLMTWKKGLFPVNVYVHSIMVIAICGLLAAVFFGHGSMPVALFGARILFLHFPLMFVIGRVFNRDDVVRMGKATLWIAIPMVLLIALQFYSPQSAWVNRGIGGDMEGGGFSGAMGFFRPPGTFSFTNGNAAFFGFVTPFLLYFWLERKAVSYLLLIGATAALLLALPLSISRTLLFQIGISLLFLGIAVLRKPHYLQRMLIGICGVIVSLALLSQTSYFKTATEAFTSRFDSASEHEGGLEGVFVDRFLGGLVGALSESSHLPFFGYGLGMGTNVGSMLLTGNKEFLIAEGEWGRVIGELGPIMGIAVVLLRIALTLKISGACYKRLSRGDLLPWMLLSFGFLNLIQGGWAQPTSLGFSTLIGGLMIASLKKPKRFKT